MESETPFTDSLIKWGRSGSLYPLLLPDSPSQEALEVLQAQIVEQSPESILSTDLHATCFYAKPTKLYEKLLEIRPGYSEAQLYLELSTTMSTVLTCFYMSSLVAEVRGIDRFGPNDEMVALKLADIVLRDDTRALLRRNLNWSGFTNKELDKLAEDPAYQWVFGPSDMHISLAGNVGEELNPSNLSLPSEITFNGLGDGSVQAPGETVEDRHRWYLMGF